MKTKILLFTCIVFLAGNLSAQEYADTVSLGAGHQWGIMSYNVGGDGTLVPDVETPCGYSGPWTKSFQWTANSEDPTTTDNVNVDMSLKFEVNFFDRNTREIIEDSTMYMWNVSNFIGFSGDPDPCNDNDDPPWIGNGDRMQFSTDEVLTVVWETLNNTPTNVLYPDVQTSVFGMVAYTGVRDQPWRWPLVYLNGEHVAYLRTDRTLNPDGKNLYEMPFITDLETKEPTKIILNEGDTLQFYGPPGTHYRLCAFILEMEDLVPATGLNLSAEGDAAEITELGGSVEINGEILPANSSESLIKWSLENNDINATVNMGGVVTAWPREAGNGTVTVRGTVGDATSTIEVTVSGQYDVLVDSIYVTSWNDSITENGGTLRMQAEVFPDIAANQDVVWSVDDAGTGATIDTTGLLIAGANDNGNGTVIVMATAADGSEVSDTMEVVIINQETVFAESIEITYDGEFAEILEDGGTLQLQVSVLPELASDDVTWSFEGDDLGATIDENGLLTASGENDGNGLVTVVATASDGSGVSATLNVTIANQSAVSVPLTELQKAVRLYPNPVKGNQTMILEISDNAAAIKAIHVLDITGRKVTEIQEFSGNASYAELSFNNEKGVYLIQVDTDKGSIIRRALVQ